MIPRTVILVEKHSSFGKLLRVTVYVFRFINNARKSSRKLIGEITVKEIICSETKWVTSEQNMKAETL